MYAGLPIIATHVGAIPEIVKNEVNGFLIPQNDPASLYRRCLQLLKNEKMRNNMGTINKEIVRNYTWSKIASSTYNLYQQVMEKHSR
jgi:glycosyltransferase involved in cell wall biosynthesis